jgi:membrane-associated phospholipid phosphatase
VTSAYSHNIQKWTANLYPTDKLFVAFWGLLAILSMLFYHRIPFWPAMVIANLAAILFVLMLARFADISSSGALRWIHDWAAFPMVIFTYKLIYYLVPPIRQGKDYDSLLIAIDHWLFRVNPTQWLAQYSSPFLTEALQISYSVFYAFFVAIGIELYLKKEYGIFKYFSLTIVYGFFLSYLAYFLLPAVGPRFTLHDFSKIDLELPGLFATPALRWFVNIFESIQPGMNNSVAHAAAQRDVFPSGHTMMTLLVIVMSWKNKLKVGPYILAAGILLIFATVYLRYHYVIDVAAGALLAILCLRTSKKLFNLLSDKN